MGARMVDEETIRRWIAAAIADSPSPGSSYLVYTALLSQSGTAAPTAEILENTLGFVPTLTRDDNGAYYLAGDFGSSAVFFFQSPGAFNAAINQVTAEQLLNEDGYPVNIIYFTTKADGVSADNWGMPIPVEIRVYP